MLMSLTDQLELSEWSMFMTVCNFRPSSTADEGLPIEYVRAEQVGFEGDCGTIYSLCPFAIYDYITDIYNGE